MSAVGSVLEAAPPRSAGASLAPPPPVATTPREVVAPPPLVAAAPVEATVKPAEKPVETALVREPIATFRQDALTDALLLQVQSQRDHAVAIAALRFHSGRLVEGDRSAFQVRVADLVTPP